MKKIKPYILELSLLLIIAVFFFKYSPLYKISKLSDRPFDPEVWGNAGDWTIITITSFTAIFLVKTFLQQKKTNNLTAAALRRSILPKLDIDGPSSEKTIAEAGSMTIKIKDNDLYNLTVEFISHDFLHAKTFYESMMTSESIILAPHLTNPYVLGDTKCIDFQFEDSEGNTYVQELKRKQYGNYMLSAPRFIKSL